MSRQAMISHSVLTTRLKFLMLQSPFGIVISPVACFALSVALHNEVAFGHLVIWNIGMTLIAAVRLLIWYAAPRKQENILQPRLWELLLGTTMVAVAAWWGSAALWILPGSLEGRILLFSGLMMMAGGTSTLYAIHPVPTVLSILALIVPISITLTLQPELLLKVLGYGSWLVILGSFRGIQMLNHFVVKSHELTYELEKNVELLQRSEKMRKDLTLMLIHDLRTPLTGLIGRVRLAKECGEDGSHQEAYQEIDRVEKISRSLREMINCILDVNRLEDDQMPIECREVDALEVLQRALRLVNGTEDRFEIRAAERANLHCDPELVERVLVNLLSNALRYQPENLPLLIYLRRSSEGLLEYRIVDHGPGISAEDQTRIFDKYGQSSRETRRGQTTGLGLTFCKLVVDRHGGEIGVDSTIGQGAEFWFRLPVAGLGS